MVQRRLDVLNSPKFPAYVVWELTLRCDQRCTHCGSRASEPRNTELSTEEALKVVSDLIALKTREVILIGGEAYLHGGFLPIVRALGAGGVAVGMTTGGRGIDAGLAHLMKDAGIDRISVSIDGLKDTHNLLRANKGSFDAALATIDHLRKASITPTVNTTINRLNQSQLEAMYELFRDRGVRAWQMQILAPLGRAADRPDMLLQPYDLLDIVPRIAKIKNQGFKDGVVIMPGNNLGYFGPEEALLRSPMAGGNDYFAGCQAGKFILGIESDGTIKGCPSLQTYFYQAGSVKDSPLTKLWHSASALLSLRNEEQKEVWGFCKTCEYSETCKGGCTFMAHSLFGKAGNNPYCHHRARVFARNNQRERLERIAPAPGEPFDHGAFKIVVEALDAPEDRKGLAHQMVKIRRT